MSVHMKNYILWQHPILLANRICEWGRNQNKGHTMDLKSIAVWNCIPQQLFSSGGIRKSHNNRTMTRCEWYLLTFFILCCYCCCAWKRLTHKSCSIWTTLEEEAEFLCNFDLWSSFWNVLNCRFASNRCWALFHSLDCGWIGLLKNSQKVDKKDSNPFLPLSILCFLFFWIVRNQNFKKSLRWFACQNIK